MKEVNYHEPTYVYGLDIEMPFIALKLIFIKITISKLMVIGKLYHVKMYEEISKINKFNVDVRTFLSKHRVSTRLYHCIRNHHRKIVAG